MASVSIDHLPALFDHDETAWLEAMAALIAAGRSEELDLTNLREYLLDMARRDRREVKRRLAILLAHRLKWVQQPQRRSRGWRKTMVVQRQALEDLLKSAVLRAYAQGVLADAYDNAREQAVAETSLPASAFPRTCPYSLEEILAADFMDE